MKSKRKTKAFRSLMLTFAVISWILPAKAQIIHRNLSPDSVLTVQPGTFGNMMLDIDGDNSDDVKLLLTNYPSFNLWNLGFQQLDTSNRKLEILYDESIPASQIGDYYVKQLSAGFEIGPSANYSSKYPQVGDVYNGNFAGAGEKYIGFRLIAGSDYKYGWLKVQLVKSAEITFTVSELAYQNSINTPIEAGSTVSSVGLPGLSQNEKFAIYPNPAEAFVNISYEGNEEIKEVRIYSIEGRLVKHAGARSLPLRVDMGGLNQGIYFIELSGQDFYAIEKLVKK